MADHGISGAMRDLELPLPSPQGGLQGSDVPAEMLHRLGIGPG